MSDIRVLVRVFSRAKVTQERVPGNVSCCAPMHAADMGLLVNLAIQHSISCVTLAVAGRSVRCAATEL